jgi:hypothetical protein
LRNDPRRLRTALDSKDRQRVSDPLVDRVGRNPKLGGDFLGAEVLVDEAEAIELGGSQFRDAQCDRVIRQVLKSSPIIVRQAVRILQSCPHLAQHRATPEPRVFQPLGHSWRFRQNFSGFPRNRLNLS